MANLLVLIFVVEVVVQAINTIGAATINNLLWALLNVFPTQASADTKERQNLQTEYLKARRELNSTSSQDEFAKWAKLRRQHDKLLENLEKKKTAVDATRKRFDNYLTGVRLLCTRGLQYFLPFWYAKEPMFWLPHGWFPYYAEWILSFPRAPIGSVSIASWQVACTLAVKMVSDTLVAAVVLLNDARQQKRAIPLKTEAGTEKTQTAEAKKEL